MKLGSEILKSTVQQLSDDNFHFYKSLVLTGDLAFQRTHFRISLPNIPRIYNHDASTDDNGDLPLQHQPSNKGRKRVIFHNDKPPCSTSAYDSYLNTSQQELLRLHETYAHADMREIQQQIKNCSNLPNTKMSFMLGKQREETIAQTALRIHHTRCSSPRV
jgi:hypothetical protein